MDESHSSVTKCPSFVDTSVVGSLCFSAKLWPS